MPRVFADAPAEGVTFIEQQCGFGIDESRAGNSGRDFTCRFVQPTVASCEGAAQNAFLDPRFPFLELRVSRKAGELCARAGATG